VSPSRPNSTVGIMAGRLGQPSLPFFLDGLRTAGDSRPYLTRVPTRLNSMI